MATRLCHSHHQEDIATRLCHSHHQEDMAIRFSSSSLSSRGHDYTLYVIVIISRRTWLHVMSSSSSGGHGYMLYVIFIISKTWLHVYIIIRRTWLRVVRHRHHHDDMATCFTLSSPSSGGHGYTFYVIIVIIRRTWLHVYDIIVTRSWFDAHHHHHHHHHR